MDVVDLEFYRAPGPFTTPGLYAALLDSLPTEIGALCRIVQGLLIHVFWADRYGVALTDDRKEELQLRPLERKLARIQEIDPQPLAVARPPQNRLVGNCRDFSVLLAGILRHKGVPARARCGFARYFLPNHFEDHWVCEYWDVSWRRWILVDAQLDDLHCQTLSVTFDPRDVPREEFLVAGEAWRRCRAGEADPKTFGIFDMHGMGFIRGNLGRDVAALNKRELLPWDSWGILDVGDADLTANDLALLDVVAECTADSEVDTGRVRRLYESEGRLRVPATIRSHWPIFGKVVELGAL